MVGKDGFGVDTKVGWTNVGAINSGTAWNFTKPYGTSVQANCTKVAVAANDPNNAVIVTGNGKPNKVTFNGGTSWADCIGLPSGMMPRNSAYDNTYRL